MAGRPKRRERKAAQEAAQARAAAGGPATVYSEELVQRIADHVEAGLKPTEAGMLEGVDEDTVRVWLGRKPTRLVSGPEVVRRPGLIREVERARVRRKLDLIGQVRRGVMASGKEGDWKAALELLRAWEADEFSVTSQINVQVQQNLTGFLRVLEARLSPEEYARVLQAVVDYYGGEPAAPPPAIDVTAEPALPPSSE